MSIIKLQKEGEALTMNVKDCEQVKGQYGEQVKFTANTGDILFLPKDSADRQLERLGLTYVTAINETLTFSRDPNRKPGAAPFWGIAVASPREANPAPSKRLQPPPVGRSAGAHIPDMDGPPAHHRSAPLPPDPWEEQPYRAPEPPLTPREEREAAGEFAPRPKEAEYLALYARVAEAVSHICEPLGIPVDAAAINATTFSIWGQR